MDKPIYYQIGSIDDSPDGGKSAFEYCENQLKVLGYNGINPVKNEPDKTGRTTEEQLKHLQSLWRSHSNEEFIKEMEKIWIADLNAVKQADFIVLHYEKTDKVIGTVLEMTMAQLVSLLGHIPEGDYCSEADKVHLQSASYHLKKAGLSPKPIYWVCREGGTTGINSTLKYIILMSGGLVFETYKALVEHLQKTYGSFPQIIKDDDLKK